jgi:hypothetical protein
LIEILIVTHPVKQIKKLREIKLRILYVFI